MLSAVLLSVPVRRRVTSSLLVPRRGLAGGHGHETPKYEGLELTVRTYLPENHQIVLAVVGGYVGIYYTIKLVRAMVFGSPKKGLEGLESVDEPSAKSAIPSVFSDKFEAWVNSKPGNEQKWEASLAAWEKEMEKSPAAAAKWEKSLA